MAISFVGYAAIQNVDPVVVTLPAGTTTDDVVYAAVASRHTSDFDCVANTSGYTELADIYANSSIDTNLGVFRKVMGATPDTTVSMDAETSAIQCGNAFVLRGVDTTTPEDATTTTATGINSNRADCPSITTVTNSAWVLAWGATATTAVIPTNAPTGYSNLKTINRGSGALIAVSSKEVTSAGAEDPGAYTDLTTGGTATWCAVTVAVRPAAGGPTSRGAAMCVGL